MGMGRLILINRPGRQICILYGQVPVLRSIGLKLMTSPRNIWTGSTSHGGFLKFLSCGVQVNVDGLDTNKDDMLFEVLPHRLRLASAKSIGSKLPVPPGTPVKTSATTRHTRTWSDSSRGTGTAALQDAQL